MINTIINKIKIWHCIAIIIIGILIRLFLFPYKVGDYIYYFEPWFVFIKSHGGFQSLKFNFYNYSPAYIYFCALIVKLNLNSLFAIKALSVIFELFAAYYVALLVNLKYNNKKIIWLVIAIFSIMPTFIINSSYWSQSDSIYSAFTIASVYYAIKKNILPLLFSLVLLFHSKCKQYLLALSFFIIS
jgi:Gpi18-like mannosyltransferase